MIRPTLLLLGLAAAALAAPAAGSAQQTPPAGGEPREFSLPAARTFSLDNGMDVTLAPYGTLPKVTVQLALRTGNVNEGPDQIWLADLMGDVMMEGTTTRSGEDIAREAAEMGGQVNVSVGPDESSVAGTVLSEFAPRLVELVADVARNPSFPASEVDRLKADLVRNVSIALSQPQQMTMSKFREVMYPDHPYGRIFPTPEMIQSYTVDGVRAFYDANVGADRAHLYVSGMFDAAAVEAAIRAAFADWASGPAPVTNPPSPVSERKVWLIDRPGAVQTTIHLGLPVADPSSEDYVALQVTNSLLGGSFNSRITSNIRENKGYTYSPFSQVSTRHRDAYWVQTADVTTDVTGASLHEIFHEIDRLQAEPPAAAELEGIQNYMAGTFVLQNSTPGGIIGQLRFLNLHGLGRDYLEGFVSSVYGVTPEEVQRIANEWLDDERMIIVATGDRATIEEQVRPYGEVVVEGEHPSPGLRRE
ncbi:MAG TPA: pitrilysin family protein [Gemmatimonadota bacterium]|nr:pitrilysin family protein [Gemmatimonadota bacterium]